MSTATRTAKGEEPMTDYQFRTIIKMVLAIAANTNDLQKVVRALKDLLPDNEQKQNEE